MRRTMTRDPIHLLPEWTPQAAVWVGWPRLAEEWGADLDGARQEIADFVRTLARHVPVRIAAGDSDAARQAQRLCGAGVDVVEIPTGDIWLRDTGPLFGHLADGKAAAAAFGFNGWGGKYDMPGDRETAPALAEWEGWPCRTHMPVLEGGALEVDGTGLALTTRSCLLNPNRNGWDEAAAEAVLRDALGLSRVVWIEEGLAGDHTDGHIDNIARFIAPGHVVCQAPSGRDDPHAVRLDEIARQLGAAGLTVSRIPSPGAVLDHDGHPLPASHMNFLMTEGAVLVPVFDGERGSAACEALAALLPDRHIEALAATHILRGGGGAFHCMTREVPRLPLED